MPTTGYIVSSALSFLVLAVGWFFKASAWSPSVPPATAQATDL